MQLFKILGGVVLALGLGFGGLMLYGKSSGEARVAEYFTAVDQGALADIQATFHPDLAAKVEPELFARFIKGLVDRYGAFKDIKTNGFRFNQRLVAGKTVRDYAGVMIFEKGEVPLEITFYDDKLAGLTIADEAIGKELLTASAGVPSDLHAYQEIGQRFWEDAAAGRASDAFARMSEPLQKTVGEGPFTAKIGAIFGGSPAATVRYLDHAPVDGAADKVELRYEITIAEATKPAQVTFQFALFKGHLVAFNLSDG